jgi:hypothetical protein
MVLATGLSLTFSRDMHGPPILAGMLLGFAAR